MKTATAALKGFLGSRPGRVIAPDCFTFTLRDGSQLFYTNADQPVSTYATGSTSDDSGVLGLGVLSDLVLSAASGGVLTTFAANSIRIDGLRYSSKVGVDVDEQDVTISCLRPAIFAPSSSGADSGVLGAGELGDMVLGSGNSSLYTFGPSTEMVKGLPFLKALADGVFDGAWLQRDRAFLPEWGAPAIGTVTLFYGRVSTIESVGRTEAKVKVKSGLVVLDSDFPRNIYQASCLHTLYDSGCGLSKTDSRWQYSGAVTSAAPDARTIPWSAGTANFGEGTITFINGPAAGESRTISFYDGTNIVVTKAFDVIPTVTSGFLANWGCDHTLGAQGCAKFNNKPNYRGFPYVPPPSFGL